MEWETVIGLEIHAQLATESKIFSGSSTRFGAEPNTQASLVDLALPGVLPVFNEQALKLAVIFGLGIGATIHKKSVFDRKNYFYPDLPKGYQISQLHHPIVGEGHVDITLADGSVKRVGVTRAHLEEDAGKSLHEDFHGSTGIDLNRAGTPLLEIVSEPDLRSAEEAVAYLKKIHSLIRYLGISDGNMAEGSMRCDINISMRPKGQSALGTRAEIKNVNSFRFVEKAITHEIERQTDILEDGGSIVQETRLYDAELDETRSMRSKEVAMDYRYFPEPDLLPIIIDDEYIETLRSTLPELPDQKKQRFIEQYGLNNADAEQLAGSRKLGIYFEETADISGSAKLSANWIIGELSGQLNKHELDIDESPITAQQLGELVLRITDNTISGKIAKKVFQEIWDGNGSADQIIESQGLTQVTDSGAIEALVDEVISANPSQVEQYKAGKEKMLGYFVGQIMKASKGKANPAQVNEILKEKLQS